jgi:hypothetical protein
LHLDDQEEGPELSQTVESPISTLKENEDEIPQPTTKIMDEKSSSSSSVEVLPTPKSKETIPHSIQISKPLRICLAMGLHRFIGQQERKAKGDDTQSVDESTEDLAEKVYLHLQLRLAEPTCSIDDYLVQTGLKVCAGERAIALMRKTTSNFSGICQSI